MALTLCFSLCGLGLCFGTRFDARLDALPPPAYASASAFHCPPEAFAETAITIPLAKKTADRNAMFLPAFHFHPSVTHPSEVEVAIIVMHGSNRDSHNYGFVMDASSTLNKDNHTAIFAPVFGDRHWQDGCSAATWTGNATAEGEAALWSQSTRQWMLGEISDNATAWSGISSFEAVDVLVDFVQVMYTHLRRVVFTGFSAGSQFGTRWAVSSPEGADGKTLRSGINLTIVLGAPNSYMYVSDLRPARRCSLQAETARDQECTAYYRPSEGNTTTARTCKMAWNKYPWGLACLQKPAKSDDIICKEVGEYVKQGLGWGEASGRQTRESGAISPISSFMGLSSRLSAEAGRSLRTEAAARFATKDFRLAIGQGDTFSCDVYPCPDDCELKGTGANRLQRAQNFVNHLRDVFHGYEPKFEVFSGGHRPELFFASRTFCYAAWEEDGFDVCLWDNFPCFSFLGKIIIVGPIALACLLTVLGLRRKRKVHGLYPPVSSSAGASMQPTAQADVANTSACGTPRSRGTTLQSEQSAT